MATKRKQIVPKRLYLEEWLEIRGKTMSDLADFMEVDRTTPYRWLRELHRLDVVKLEKIAAYLEIKPPQLWDDPRAPSIDAKLVGVDSETREWIAGNVDQLMRRPRG